MTYGLNVAGFFQAPSGLGTAVRGVASALQARAIPHSCLTVTTPPQTVHSNPPYPISLLHVNPDQLQNALSHLPPAFFEKTYTIGYWTWETSQIPSSWKAAAMLFDELWVPSTYTTHILSAAIETPVVHMPHVVEPRTVGTPPTLPDGWIVLCMVDYFSTAERKNPLGAIAAFLNAFPRDPDVHLIIKCLNAEKCPQEHTRVQNACHDPRIHIIDTPLSSEDTLALLRHSDVFLSLHRSEGFGLSIAEAMILGTPVITTNFGGVTDFITERNSFPVAYTLSEIPHTHMPYRRGSVWAEPDTEHAAMLLRHVKTADLTPYTQNAKKTLQAFSEEVVGGKIEERLKHLTTS